MAYTKYFESSKKGKLVIDYLIKKLGWYKYQKGIAKDFAKKEGGGMIDASGKLVIPAYIEGDFLVATHKGEYLHRELISDETESKPEIIAKIFDQQVTQHLIMKRAIVEY